MTSDIGQEDSPAPTLMPRRSAREVMRLSRLGALHQCRLSFMRQLTRRFARESWWVERRSFDIDMTGVGQAVYSVNTPERVYSLIVFTHQLADENRSDRVIAEAWDATFTLFDGIPSKTDIDRLSRNVPYQEAGRVTEKELTLSRANKSARLWAYVISSLAQGRQPDLSRITSVGYLMRTTAVYGSGKFGAADRETIADRPEFAAPFQAELLSVYLFRAFVIDLVNHAASCQGGAQAILLDPDTAQKLGIGNSTGLGMAPFIINHPLLFNNWVMAREEAIARVRSLADITPDAQGIFMDVFFRVKKLVSHWHSTHLRQMSKLVDLRADLQRVEAWLPDVLMGATYPWHALMSRAAAELSIECEELLASLMLEPYGELIDGLGGCMADSYEADFLIDGAVPVKEMRESFEQIYDFALNIEWTDRKNCARAWYVSEEKLEPRLGERFEEPIEDYEQPLAPARDAALAYQALASWPDETSIADFLTAHLEHRGAIWRLQLVQKAPYGEIRDNTIANDLMPIDMLRAKLSFFGATKFDPRSDRWVRISMFAGAPLPADLDPQNADFWVYDGV